MAVGIYFAITSLILFKLLTKSHYRSMTVNLETISGIRLAYKLSECNFFFHHLANRCATCGGKAYMIYHATLSTCFSSRWRGMNQNIYET